MLAQSDAPIVGFRSSRVALVEIGPRRLAAVTFRAQFSNTDFVTDSAARTKHDPARVTHLKRLRYSAS